MKIRERVDKLKVEGTVYEDALQQIEVMNKCFQTVLTRESEFRINNVIITENLMENRNRRKKSKTADGKPIYHKSAGSRWSTKLNNERMLLSATRKVT